MYISKLIERRSVGEYDVSSSIFYLINRRDRTPTEKGEDLNLYSRQWHKILYRMVKMWFTIAVLVVLQCIIWSACTGLVREYTRVHLSMKIVDRGKVSP